MKSLVSLFLILSALESPAAVTGQLWYGVGYGNVGDTVIGHINSDGSSAVVTQRGGDISRIDVAVDPAAGFYWGLDPATGPAAGTPSSDPYALSLLEYSLNGSTNLVQSLTIGDSSDQDEVNCMAIDPANHRIYVAEWGSDQAHSGIEIVTYDPATGAMTGGLNNPAFLVNNANFSGLDRVEYMSIDLVNHKLYFVDNDNGYSLPPFSQDNAVYVVDYSSNDPVPIKLTSNANQAGGFPTGPGVGEGGGTAATDDPNGLLAAVAANSDNQLVYFTSCQFTEDGANTGQDALWYVDPTTPTQAAVKVGFPAGVTLNYPAENSGLSYDPVGHLLYIADLNRSSGPDSRILCCQLTANGKNVTSVQTNSMSTLTGNATVSQDAAPLGTTFLSLPVPTLAGSTNYAVGGAAVALSAAMTVNAPTDGYLTGADVSISGDFLPGDTLSASTGGTSIAASFNAGTGILTLANYDTVSNYQTVLRSVAFATTNASANARMLTWVLRDGLPNIPAGAVNTSNMTVIITTPPVFTSVASANFVAGSFGTFTVRASGNPAPTLSESASDSLPSGVQFAAATGVLSGTPGTNTAGVYVLHFFAQNGSGTASDQTFTLTVGQAPEVTCPGNIQVSAPGGVCLPSVAFAATATGSPTPIISYQLNGSPITPPALFPVGTSTVTSMASNVAGTNTCSFTVTVTAGPAPQLTAALESGKLVLSWPSGYGCYALQMSPALTGAAWSDYPGPFTTNGASVFVTNGLQNSSLFFRLKD